MSLIAVADIAHPDLALMPTIESGVSGEISVVSQSTTDPETARFFFAVEGADESFEPALAADHTVSDWTLVSEDGDTRVYRIGHPEGTLLLSPMVVEVGGLMLESRSDGERGWTVRLQLADREALSELWEFCEREGISFDLKRMFRQKGWTSGEPSTLTDAQRDALVAGYEHGYFDEPRGASLADLAEVLGISPSAVNGRLRRGTHELIESVLVEE